MRMDGVEVKRSVGTRPAGPGLSYRPSLQWVAVLVTFAAVTATSQLALSPSPVEASLLTHVRAAPGHVTVVAGGVMGPRTSSQSRYPIGTPRSSEPSGLAPPGATALTGYKLRYLSDFLGTTVPAGWDVFTGVPGGNPGGQFGRRHVVVSGGLLRLNVWRDPQYGGKWVTGGLCHCGHVQRYGAYFVRSRLTGAGPNEIQLLWPASDIWPPEIDFNETGGGIGSTSSTVHYGISNKTVRLVLRANMTAWHTWGVMWSPRVIDYIVDGRVWASITTPSQIPHVPMRLDIEQRAMCALGRQCPKEPVSMLVDWVVEYSPQ